MFSHCQAIRSKCLKSCLRILTKSGMLFFGRATRRREAQVREMKTVLRGAALFSEFFPKTTVYRNVRLADRGTWGVSADGSVSIWHGLAGIMLTFFLQVIVVVGLRIGVEIAPPLLTPL